MTATAIWRSNYQSTALLKTADERVAATTLFLRNGYTLATQYQ